MDTINTEINLLIKSNKLHRYKSEFDNITDIERKENLQVIINSLDTKKIDESRVQKQIDKMHSNIDAAQLKKEWIRLPNYYKEIKLKEYANGNEEYEQKLLTSLTEGKLKTNKKVIYDNKICKIIDIPAVTLDKVENNN